MMVSQTVLPYVIDQGRMGFGYIWSRSRFRAQVNQDDLNEMATPPDFDLPPRYGEYHATLFVAFALSSGIPFLMHLFCAFLLFGFFSDRLALLRLAEKPVATDESLSILSLSIVPYAAVLHFGFGVWMYGAASTRYIEGGPGYDVSDPGDVGGLFKSGDMTFAQQFDPRKRIWKMAALPQFVGFVVVCVVLLFRVLARPVERYVMSFQDKKRRHIWEDVTELPPLNVVMPQYMVRKKKVRAGAVADAADASRSGEAAGPMAVLKNVVFAENGRPIQWKGALHYDMTTDHRHVMSFAHLSATGKLSDEEARLFTVFDHGNRGRRPPKAKLRTMTRKETIRFAQMPPPDEDDEEVAEGDVEYEDQEYYEEDDEAVAKKEKNTTSVKPGTRPGMQPGGDASSRRRMPGDEEDPYEPPRTAAQI